MPFSSTLSHCFSLSSPFPSVLSVAYLRSSVSSRSVHLSSLSSVPPSSSSIRLAGSSAHSRTSSEIEFISRFYKLCSLVLRGRGNSGGSIGYRIRITHRRALISLAFLLLTVMLQRDDRRFSHVALRICRCFSNYSRYYISLYTADS